MLLLDIDKPLKTAKLHRIDCSQIPRPIGNTLHKPVGELRRDGGWFHVSTEDEGRELARRKLPRAQFARCQHC